jgi:TatD DNase family protein
MTGWMDTHCHLCLLKPEQGSVAEVVSRLASAGVHRILDVATGKDNWQCVADNAANFDAVYAGIGIHPTSEMQETESDWALLSQLLQDNKVLAVGECGLDFYHEAESECAHQYARFERQIHLAQSFNKPLIIHTRHSSQQTLQVLNSVGRGQVTGIMHCFVEDKAVAQQALDLGFYLSFSGISTFKNATQVQEVIAWAPLDRLLIETDSPYLAPVPYRGKLNEPAYVAKVGESMAKLKGISNESLAEALEQNAQRLFGW